jgi:hypothetical protein
MVANQDTLATPQAEKLIRTLRRSDHSRIVRFSPIVRQSDGIAGVQTIQVVLLIFRQGTARRDNHIGQCANLGKVISPAAKRQ